MWTKLKLKIYLWLTLPKTRIMVEWNDTFKELRYIPEGYYLVDNWYGYLSLLDDANWMGYGTLKESKDLLEEVLTRRTEELTKEFFIPKTKYIKYP